MNDSAAINVTLAIGQVSEQVEVQANATLVETQSTGVGRVIDNQRVLELPLNGRQVTDLITLSGMAVQTGSGGGHSRSGVNISVAGGNSYGVQYSLDGAPHINNYDGTGMPLPFPDAAEPDLDLVGDLRDGDALRGGGRAAPRIGASGAACPRRRGCPMTARRCAAGRGGIS